MNARHGRYVAAVAAAAVTFGAAPAAAQQQPGNAPAKWADTISSEIDKAQLASDASKLDAAVALANRVATAYPNDGLILHYAGYAQYRQAVLLASKGGAVAPELESAKALLVRSLDKRPLPETHVLIASIDGQLLMLDPNRVMELGMEAQSEDAEALTIGATNPRAWLLVGQAAIFTPPEYGGGLPLAETQLKHAVELFVTDAPKQGEPSWGKAEAYAWLGQVYEKSGDKANAASMYDKAIATSPTYAYAKALRAALQ